MMLMLMSWTASSADPRRGHDVSPALKGGILPEGLNHQQGEVYSSSPIYRLHIEPNTLIYQDTSSPIQPLFLEPSSLRLPLRNCRLRNTNITVSGQQIQRISKAIGALERRNLERAGLRI